MIDQIIFFSVSPQKAYDALMNSKSHSEITGAKAHIENKTGGAFSVWDGYATGKNIQLIPGKKIVQEWRASDWPTGETSQVTFEFSPDKKGTKLHFIHENVPADFEADIKTGWNDYYWKPMRAYFSK